MISGGTKVPDGSAVTNHRYDNQDTLSMVSNERKENQDTLSMVLIN